MRKKIGLTKYQREKIPDPRNTHDFRTHEIPTRKKIRSTKYPREKFFDQQNTNKGTMALDHENHDGTRLKKFSTLSLQTISYILLVGFMLDKTPRLNNKHRMT